MNNSLDVQSDDIPTRLKDQQLTSTTKKNPNFYYIICIILRIILGILVYYEYIPNNYIYLFSIFIISVFSFKYINKKRNWKNYIRPVINYSLVITFTYLNDYNTNIGGIFIILDTLLGQQSKFIQSNFKS